MSPGRFSRSSIFPGALLFAVVLPGSIGCRSAVDRVLHPKRPATPPGLPMRSGTKSSSSDSATAILTTTLAPSTRSARGRTSALRAGASLRGDTTGTGRKTGQKRRERTSTRPCKRAVTVAIFKASSTDSTTWSTSA